MKEFLVAAVIIALVAYFWFQPAAPELAHPPREKRRPETATVATPANNPTRTVGSVAVSPSTDGSLTSRWKTLPSGQTNLTATVPDRWKTGPNAQSDLTGTPPDRRSEERRVGKECG